MGPNPIDLVCQELVEHITDYLSHALAAGDRARFEKHLLTCPPCTAYLAQMRTTIELAGELKEQPPIETVKGELLTLFRTLHKQ